MQEERHVEEKKKTYIYAKTYNPHLKMISVLVKHLVCLCKMCSLCLEETFTFQLYSSDKTRINICNN